MLTPEDKTIVESADLVSQRVDAIIRGNDPEVQHGSEDDLVYNVAMRYAPPEIAAQLERLAAANFNRWYG